MATKRGSAESGKIGNKIYYTWHGRQCERAMPRHVANPRTAAQQAHRARFAAIAQLSSHMKEAHRVGLHWLAVREKNSTYALFRRLNKDCFTPDGEIDFPRVAVSKGTVPAAVITAAAVDAGGLLSVAFDGFAVGGENADLFHLFVYCPALGCGLLATPVPRLAGRIAVRLPAGWLQPAPDSGAAALQAAAGLHLYAFLLSPRGLTSDTIHHAL